MALTLLLLRQSSCITLTLHNAQWVEHLLYIYMMLTPPPSHARFHAYYMVYHLRTIISTSI